MDQISILFKEYDALRTEVQNRTNHGHQIAAHYFADGGRQRVAERDAGAVARPEHPLSSIVPDHSLQLQPGGGRYARWRANL